MDIRAVVEAFHLVFLSHLGQKIPKSSFALKGGCNLRFYFKSIRYSEDIDLDIQSVAVHTLRKNVSNILQANSFLQTLRTRQIEISQISEPKQTETTQRWKLALRFAAVERDLPTKIEFSRREQTTEAILEPIDPELVASYQLYPILCPHYSRSIAAEQKISALAHRQAPQARDVFDLAHLLQGSGDSLSVKISAKERKQAEDRVGQISFDEFKGQVVAFLMPEYQAHYDRHQEWEKIQKTVAEFLKRCS